MSDVKPTPGPWTTENATGRLPLDIICDYQIPGAGYPVLIATVFSDEDEDANFQKNAESIDNRQAMANARLIAAAPCMLAMLDRCIVELRSMSTYGDGLADASILQDAIALKRKITKPE